MSLTVAETKETLRGLAPHLATRRPRTPQGALQQTLNATLTYAIIKIVLVKRNDFIDDTVTVGKEGKENGNRAMKQQ